MMAAHFPRQARVRARAEYDKVFKHGRRTASPVLALHLHLGNDASAPRLGLAVSRKVDPRAVGRNRIKRVLRETFRHCRASLASGDYVLVARPPARGMANADLAAAFLKLLQRAGALPATGPAGTMPTPRGPEPSSSTAPVPSSDAGRACPPACP